jgi:hypothetical protein
MTKQFRLLGYLFMLLVIACKKEKIAEEQVSFRGDQVLNKGNSGIRLFNLNNIINLEVTANNIPLTANGNPNNVNNIGLSIFPQGIWKGQGSSDVATAVNIPTSLLDSKGRLHLQINPPNIEGAPPFRLPGIGDINVLKIDTVIQDDPANPKDYYVFSDGHLRAVNRDNTAPSSPDRFKIRVMNLAGTQDTIGNYGAVVLTYADGTPVDNRLAGVGPGQTSAYLELPYGAYQFKLFMADAGGRPDYKRQLAELPGVPPLEIPSLHIRPQQGLTTRVRNYKPGGAYTILLAPGVAGFDIGRHGDPYYENEIPFFVAVNAYKVINDLPAGANISYARLQGVNAFSSLPVKFMVDGELLPAPKGFGTAGEYATLVLGKHQVQALDANGAVLAEKTITLYTYDAITAWVFEKDGKPDLVFSNTDMTSTVYALPRPPSAIGGTDGEIDDGTDGERRILSYPYALQMRFLNLSNIPSVTFTTNGEKLQGTPFLPDPPTAYAEAYVNLLPGVLPVDNPFVVYNSSASAYSKPGEAPYWRDDPLLFGKPNLSPFPLKLYASIPGKPPYAPVLPGYAIPEVKPLNADAMIVNPEMYQEMSRVWPENGFYSVAVIGKRNLPASHPEHSRIIVIKHNK